MKKLKIKARKGRTYKLCIHYAGGIDERIKHRKVFSKRS